MRRCRSYDHHARANLDAAAPRAFYRRYHCASKKNTTECRYLTYGGGTRSDPDMSRVPQWSWINKCEQGS